MIIHRIALAIPYPTPLQSRPLVLPLMLRALAAEKPRDAEQNASFMLCTARRRLPRGASAAPTGSDFGYRHIPLLPLSSFRAPIGSQHVHGSIESTAVHDDKLGDLSSLASG
jgi:hypothetical protein